MRLILTTVPLAIVIGYLARGRLGNLSSFHPRWPWLALGGAGAQFAPFTGPVGAGLLVLSFVLLIAFAAVNIRLAGLPIVLVGLALNLTVIAVNQGMPITKRALIDSGQADTLPQLRAGAGGTKHHLADDDTIFPALGDVIAIGPPIRQAISIGDIFTHLGAAWFVVASMRRRQGATEDLSEPGPTPKRATEAQP